jgi:geranylgeranyl diphosphate synthase type II
MRVVSDHSVTGNRSIVDQIDDKMMAITGADHPDTRIEKSVQYHLHSGGSRTRAKLTAQTALSLGIDQADAIVLATIPELFHNASLIHDDIQDRGGMRRGQPSVWKKFGAATAICAGDFLISAAYSALAELSDPRNLGKLTAHIHQRIKWIIDGQMADLYPDDGTEKDALQRYQRAVARKSGYLLAMPLTCPMIYANAEAQAIEHGENASLHYAIAYQMYDDLADMAEDRERADGCLNYPLIIERLGDGDPIGQTKVKALNHLDTARTHSDKLPNKSGDPILNIILELHHRIRDF